MGLRTKKTNSKSNLIKGGVTSVIIASTVFSNEKSNVEDINMKRIDIKESNDLNKKVNEIKEEMKQEDIKRTNSNAQKNNIKAIKDILKTSDLEYLKKIVDKKSPQTTMSFPVDGYYWMDIENEIVDVLKKSLTDNYQITYEQTVPVHEIDISEEHMNIGWVKIERINGKDIDNHEEELKVKQEKLKKLKQDVKNLDLDNKAMSYFIKEIDKIKKDIKKIKEYIGMLDTTKTINENVDGFEVTEEDKKSFGRWVKEDDGTEVYVPGGIEGVYNPKTGEFESIEKEKDKPVEIKNKKDTTTHVVKEDDFEYTIPDEYKHKEEKKKTPLIKTRKHKPIKKGTGIINPFHKLGIKFESFITIDNEDYTSDYSINLIVPISKTIAIKGGVETYDIKQKGKGQAGFNLTHKHFTAGFEHTFEFLEMIKRSDWDYYIDNKNSDNVYLVSDIEGFLAYNIKIKDEFGLNVMAQANVNPYSKNISELKHWNFTPNLGVTFKPISLLVGAKMNGEGEIKGMEVHLIIHPF